MKKYKYKSGTQVLCIQLSLIQYSSPLLFIFYNRSFLRYVDTIKEFPDILILDLNTLLDECS